MKVHGKDAVCHYDSEESEDEASSPSSSMVSGQHGHVTNHVSDPWPQYTCPPQDHTMSPPTNVKFENHHHHSIGGLIGSGYQQSHLSVKNETKLIRWKRTGEALFDVAQCLTDYQISSSMINPKSNDFSRATTCLTEEFFLSNSVSDY